MKGRGGRERESRAGVGEGLCGAVGGVRSERCGSGLIWFSMLLYWHRRLVCVVVGRRGLFRGGML